MLYNFRWNISLRVIILVLLVVGLVLSFEKGFFLSTAFFGILLAFSVGNMIYYVNQTNRDIANFFASVRYDDFTTTASAGHKGTSFQELHEGFKLISRKFQHLRAEKEANHQFLQTIIEHIDIGLMGIDEDGKVILMNKALQRLLHKSYLLSLRGLLQVDEGLYQSVSELEPGERRLIKLNINNRLVQLAVRAIDLRLQREPFRLITFQNIQTELEEQELIAWQKLIRILTHEIMNSVAPISSLSATLLELLADEAPLNENGLAQVKTSMEVIRRRSEGLLNFTDTYRSLMRIPPPRFQATDPRELVREMETLFRTELENRGIRLTSHTAPASLTIQADPALLEQVLINLMRNAMDAVAAVADPAIELYTLRDTEGRVIIQVADNGPGIPPEMMDQIFIPFFTTKASGSGIGLSLSRQIMRLHKGAIEVQSAEGQGTVVTLAF